ncbi:MAG: hypothetical protein AAF125_10135, partial [Chloroflexota bacterium]
SVEDNRLLYGGSPLVGYDYILLQIERRAERDDWRFSYIDKPLEEIGRAYADGNMDKATSLEGALKFAVFDSEDFTFNDKKRVMWLIAQRLEFLRETDFGALSADGTKSVDAATLNEMVRRRQTALPESTPYDDIQTEDELLTLF